MKAQPPFADSKPIRGGDVAGKGFSLPRMPEPSTDWEANPGADRAPDPAPFPRQGVGAGPVAPWYKCSYSPKREPLPPTLIGGDYSQVEIAMRFQTTEYIITAIAI